MQVGGVDAGSAPVYNTSFFEPGFNQDPYPVLEEIRAQGRVVHNESRHSWMLTSYRDVVYVLGHAQEFALPEGVLLEVFGGPTMETIDDPARHNAMRAIWAKDFQRDRLREIAPLVERVVDDQLGPFVERVRAGEQVDAVANLTRNVPTLVIAHLLGIETSMFAQFSAWSDAMGAIPEGALDPSEEGKAILEAGHQATRQLNEYIASQVAARRGAPSDDLIGKMVHAPYAESSMTEQEIVASNTQLVFAGNETTAKLMAHTLVSLAEHPDQRRLVTEDRDLIPQAVEEVLRWQTIAQFIDRQVQGEPVEIAGVTLPVGSMVTVMHGAANRDPERWERPGSFDVTRPPRPHLGFGFGMHNCIGLNLARLELHVWLNRLLDVLPDYEVVGPVDYGANFQLRGPSAVEIAR